MGIQFVSYERLFGREDLYNEVGKRQKTMEMCIEKGKQ